jgi:hypothetical protein
MHLRERKEREREKIEGHKTEGRQRERGLRAILPTVYPLFYALQFSLSLFSLSQMHSVSLYQREALPFL